MGAIRTTGRHIGQCPVCPISRRAATRSLLSCLRSAHHWSADVDQQPGHPPPADSGTPATAGDDAGDVTHAQHAPADYELLRELGVRRVRRDRIAGSGRAFDLWRPPSPIVRTCFHRACCEPRSHTDQGRMLSIVSTSPDHGSAASRARTVSSTSASMMSRALSPSPSPVGPPRKMNPSAAKTGTLGATGSAGAGWRRCQPGLR